MTSISSPPSRTHRPATKGLPGSARPRTRQLLKTIESLARDQHQVVVLSADFADSNEWAADGQPTAAHWIAQAADIEVATAREWIRIGRKIRELPSTAEAFAAKAISYSKVRTLTRLADPDNEADLLELAERTTAGNLGRAIASWVERNSTDDELERHQANRRSCSWRVEPDGMTIFTARLPPIAAAGLIARIERMVRVSTGLSRTSSGLQRSNLSQQYADALAALAHPPLGDGAGFENPGFEVVLHVRGDGCSTDDGTPIAGSIVERVAPIAFIRALVYDAQRRPINASGRRRHPTARQKRLVKERDKVCVDCGSSTLLEYDHVPAFTITRRTEVDGLQLRCAMCHARRHGRDEPTWKKQQQ